MEMKTLEQKILEEENRFYVDNAHEPTYLILNPYTAGLLEEELLNSGEEHLFSHGELVSYNGLRVAVSTHPSLEEFSIV